MGAWGYELFQSDNDLEWIDYICDEAGTTLDYPDNAGEVRKELDNGLLAKTFERYLGEKDVQEYGILMLGILAMQLGARMDDKYLNIMRGIYNRDCGLYPLGKAQVKLALDAYRNDGTPWDFERTGRGTAASYIAFDNYT